MHGGGGGGMYRRGGRRGAFTRKGCGCNVLLCKINIFGFPRACCLIDFCTV